MASSQQHLCDVCINQHITQNAIIRCPECEENFCEKCKIHHEFAKATRKHEIVSIENVLKLPKFVQDIKITCADHDERFVLYCDDHGVPCCTHCLQNAHAGCRNLIPFQKLFQNVKASSLLVDLEETLSDLITNTENVIEDRTANLLDLKGQKMRCKKKIKTAREAINAYFDELEADLLRNLQKIFTEKELEIQKMLEEFQLRKANICEMQDNTNIVKRIASEFQSFMAIRELAQSANCAETELQQLFDGGSTDWIEISYVPPNLDSIKGNSQLIGNSNVKVHPSKIELRVRKTREAQLIGPITSSINIETIQVKEKVKSKLPKGRYEIEILDCGFLPDGNLIFVDRKNHRLVIHDSNGVFVRSLQLSFRPIRFAVIDEKNIAITTENQVNILDSIKNVVVRTLVIGAKARSISLIDDKHLMVENFQLGFILIDLDSNIATYIPVRITDTGYHFPVCIKERLYYVDIPNAILHCCDFDGKQVSQFGNKLFVGNIALTSDKSNVLFCSSWYSNNVSVISTDGKSSKEIIKPNEYLKQIIATHYNINKSELLIVTKNGNFILYDVI